MKNLHFGGYGISLKNERIQFPIYINPTKENISEILLKTSEYVRGVIEICIEPEPEAGIFRLTVEYDGGYYFPTLSVYSDDGDIDVKNWIDNDKYSGQEISIGGYYYPIELTTKDKNIINSLLVKFIENANLLLQIMR